MRLVVLGDVHGNYYALESVVNDAIENYGEEIDGFVFAGDYVGDFPDGSKVVELMQKIASKYKTYMIRGNREDGQVIKYLEAQKEGKIPDGWSLDTTMGAALVCCQELRQDQLEYLANLPETLVIREEGVKPLFLKHKMPLTEEEIKMVKQENMSIITAHTHEANDEDKDGILLFNPGSIGLPDEGIQGTTYGVLESNLNGDWDFTIRDVSYDYFKTITSLKEHKDIYDRCCGWGKALELSVSTGINCTALYSFEANRLARLVEEAKQKGEEPNLNAIEDLNYIFSQGRYGNTNYDNSQLVDTTIEDAGDAYVFGPTKVITSPPSPKGHKPTKEIYDIALNNIKKVVASANREVVYYGRHESILK